MWRRFEDTKYVRGVSRATGGVVLPGWSQSLLAWAGGYHSPEAAAHLKWASLVLAGVSWPAHTRLQPAASAATDTQWDAMRPARTARTARTARVAPPAWQLTPTPSFYLSTFILPTDMIQYSVSTNLSHGILVETVGFYFPSPLSAVVPTEYKHRHWVRLVGPLRIQSVLFRFNSNCGWYLAVLSNRQSGTKRVSSH